MPRRLRNVNVWIEMKGVSKSRYGVLLDADDGRPGARGDVYEASNYHVFELHPPLPKAPLLICHIEWEQLRDVSEPVRKREAVPTHMTVGLEI